MGFDIVIIGAGIAGLGSAIALRNKGHQVTVLEATTELQPVGGIIVLQANANRILDGLGVYQALLPSCTKLPQGPSTRRYDNGEYLVKKPADFHEKEYGYPLWPLHRAELQRVLYNAAIDRGVAFRFGNRVVSIEDDDTSVSITLADSQRALKIAADVIVGADGVESQVRRSVGSDACSPIDSGMTVIRGFISEDTARLDPETAVLMEEIGLWCGPKASIAIMPVRLGENTLLGFDCCYRRDEVIDDEQGKEQCVKHLGQFYGEFDSVVQKVLFQAEDVRTWRLMEAKPSSWGGGMALEDGAVLAECLERAGHLKDISGALNMFQMIRQPRCTRVQEWSARKGRRATLPDGSEQMERDTNLKSFNGWMKLGATRNIGELPEPESPAWKPWLSGYDAVRVANRELDRIYGT
ncbi:FAD/NAD(P)-binding domain-containing protein [Aaosphaeria arxii CBS 175.79]|uniref:FAD/NAD(P)-binding domain-containing protein n=1 Tax=Aaosphaeria arxii CBS 175.79 TaxID=1450172 RepID=A0A6A5Y342_9PLEO|nr:FAD/NAD(P)-binding domain-containing protein [Aaosphaeria arxii CBS 175.79]KAF2019220.1 FAD/NAD(P)-binding domain-containing protein [Aaosphaeria arxii CBS 175.79]